MIAIEIKPNIAYHCATRELAEQFLKEAEEQGYSFGGKRKPTEYILYYDEYGENTCFCVDIFGLSYCEKKHYLRNCIDYINYNVENATDINVDTKVETAWVIQRDDGKFYTGKGSPNWRGDPSWKKEMHSATFYTQTYLAQGLRSANSRCGENQTCKAIRVEIKVVEE